MPKKTLKQKKRSEAKRLNTTYTLADLTHLPSITAPQPKMDKSPYILLDLKRTVILGLLFIIAEFILAYFSPRIGW